MNNKIESAPVIKERTGCRYLKYFKDAIRRNCTYTEITVREKSGLTAVFSFLKENGKKTNGSNFSIQNLLITFNDKGCEYIIKIERLGGMSPDIKFGVGENICQKRDASIREIDHEQ